MKSRFSIFAFFITGVVFAQVPPPTPSSQVARGLEKMQQMAASSEYKNLKFENIGPASCLAGWWMWT